MPTIYYGEQNEMFTTLEAYQEYLIGREHFRQKAIVVKQQAAQNLRDQFGELLAQASTRYDRLEFMVITETGEISYFRNRTTALDWARDQNKQCAVGEIRGFQIIDIPEEEVATRVAAL